MSLSLTIESHNYLLIVYTKFIKLLQVNRLPTQVPERAQDPEVLVRSKHTEPEVFRDVCVQL